MRPLSLIARAAVVLGLLLLPTRAYAQAHPCDAPPPTTTPVATSPVTVGFCHDSLDTTGATTTLTQFTVRIGASVTSTQTLSPQGAANSAGYRYYQFTPVSVLTPGTYQVTVTAWNGNGEGAPSAATPVCVSCTFTITVSPIQ